eukprot:gnl/MRDRNA2_/MRDRNA2_206267_c0_seq1.p1 gnl/MRDRNA2_/MRDRNA2_206267_c0~~gnl/MRDRNA2_/MRDRNA2_206267_c0_seq1.p1  ORF type:complete len:355 (+),score=63.91 gnl/MRDRNA2_/MRDRNA2_206267_c0_seq1:85-1149(+)
MLQRKQHAALLLPASMIVLGSLYVSLHQWIWKCMHSSRPASRGTFPSPFWMLQGHLIALQRIFRMATSPLRSLPDFYIIGAAKAGTWALKDYLAMHPAIMPPEDKESRFFLGSLGLRLRPTLYRSFFPLRCTKPLRRLTFDADPYMSMMPKFSSAWIKRVTPDAKVICVYREPVERLWSYYQFVSKIKGHPDAGVSLPDILQAEKSLCDAPAWGALDRLTESLEAGAACVEIPADLAKTVIKCTYLNGGRYGDVLREYHERQGRSNVLFVPFQDLCKETETTVRKIFKFLGVDDTIPLPQIDSIKPEDYQWVIHEGTSATVELDESLKAELMSYYEKSNLEFAAGLNVDVSRLW